MNFSLGWLAVLPASLLIASASCSPTAHRSGVDSGGDNFDEPDGVGGKSEGTSSTAAGQGGVDFIDAGPVGAGGMAEPCVPDPNGDVDKDGFTEAAGDCNDCDPSVNPNAAEVVDGPDNAPHDENCNGEFDEVEPPCDADIAAEDEDPMNGARAVELCKPSTGPGDWGVIEAKWVMVDGSPPPKDSLAQFHLGHGILDGFGSNVTPRRGARILALSSGSARQPKDKGYENVQGFNKGYSGNHPQGFPKESPACPGTITGQPHDATAIDIKLRVPSNAQGFAFDFNFYTYEWPGFVCSSFNDFFVSLMDPIPPGQQDGNISFDSQGNPVSVNNAFIEVCGCNGNPPNACTAGGKSFPCALGDSELVGTGFGFDMATENHGATSWLTTKAPVDPGSEMTIRWGAYDSGDGVLDSSAVIDNWRWLADPGTTVTTVPVPQ